MAMSKCKECGKAVSTLAKTCPSCGVPKPAKVLKKKISTKKTITKSKKKKPNVSSTKKTSTEEYVYNPNTGSYDKGSKKIKKDSSYDFKTGYNPKTGSFERESKKNKEQELTRVHCANHECNNYGEMGQIPSTALGHRICYNCNGYLIKGKPTMPRKRVKKKNKPDDNVKTEWKTPEQINYEIDPGSSGYSEYIKQNPDYKKQKNKVQNTPGEGNVFDKFADGHLDLATAFWGFGVVGTMIVGFICGWLSEAYSKWWLIPYIIFVVMVIDGLWAVARNYKIEQVKKKQSEVWGFLVQAFCVMGGLGLFTLIKDTFF